MDSYVQSISSAFTAAITATDAIAHASAVIIAVARANSIANFKALSCSIHSNYAQSYCGAYTRPYAEAIS